MKHFAIILFALLYSFSSIAQNKQAPEDPSPIIFIYDASGSMWGQLQGKTKMQIVSEVLSASIQELPENQKIGLVAYGHRKKGDCRDVQTLVAMNNSSKAAVSSEVKSIKPLGRTPLAYSASTVIDQLRIAKAKATIILITDGIESCDGNICDVVSKAKKEGIDFKLHIVGFGLKKGETEELKCAANAGGGNYYDAADAGGLSEALGEVVVQTVDKEAENHGVLAVMNGVGIDALVTAYHSGTQEKAGGIRTYQDTGFIYLPEGLYDIKVAPLENSKVKPITIKGIQTSGEKQTRQVVSFDGGKFLISTTNNNEGWDCVVKITDQEGTVVGGTRTYGRTKEVELNPGVYNVHLQALKMKGLSTNTELSQLTVNAGENTEVSHNFTTGILEILPSYNGALIDCSANVVHVQSGTSVAGGRTYTKGSKFHMTTGNYAITVKALGPNAGLGSKTINVTVNEGETISKTITF